ncbi:hypothetical protein [Nostoc sp.]|uniref:hypothetical protein n=1 Tax=Nostoc sp. TaxID=1180 RepID=UPI002FF9CAB8
MRNKHVNRTVLISLSSISNQHNSNPTFSPTFPTPSHKTADFSRLTKQSAIA